MILNEDGEPSVSVSVSVEASSQWEADDPRAFVAAVRPWQDSVFRILYRILGSSHDAEDVWQTLMLRLLRTSNKLPESTHLAAWLRRCAVNEAISFLRRRGLRNGQLTEEVPSDVPQAIEKLADDEFSIMVGAALAEFSAEQRALLTLRFDEGLTVREIAVVLERPSSTVQFQLKQAIEKLRSRLGITALERT